MMPHDTTTIAARVRIHIGDALSTIAAVDTMGRISQIVAALQTSGATMVGLCVTSVGHSLHNTAYIDAEVLTDTVDGLVDRVAVIAHPAARAELIVTMAVGAGVSAPQARLV